MREWYEVKEEQRAGECRTGRIEEALRGKNQVQNVQTSRNAISISLSPNVSCKNYFRKD